MVFKGKLIGILLIVIGALPFLTGIKAIGDFFTKYAFLSAGATAYQIIIIVLGVLLIIRLRKNKLEFEPAGAQRR